MSDQIGRIPRQWLSERVTRFMLGSLHEWMSVVLVFLTLAIAVWSIEQAKWIKPQPSLTLVLGLAVLTSLLLIRSRISNKVTPLLMIGLGIFADIIPAGIQGKRIIKREPEQ